MKQLIIITSEKVGEPQLLKDLIATMEKHGWTHNERASQGWGRIELCFNKTTNSPLPPPPKPA